MKKTILIKDSFLAPNKYGFISGVGRSSLELLKQFIRINDPEIEFKLYCTGRNSIGFNHYDLPLEYHGCPFPKKFGIHDFFDPYYRKIFGYDMIHFTSNYDSVLPSDNFVITIHDMIDFHSSEDARKKLIKCSRYAKTIITCSNYSKNEIVKLLGVPENKVKVIYWGINHSIFFPRNTSEINSTLSKYGVTQPYFFSCSFSSPRKNGEITIAAFRDFLKIHENAKLVITWIDIPQKLREEYDKEISSGSLVILPKISDEELARFYSGALCSFLISSYEGFGFPILESFACGTPSVSCKNTSQEEIGNKYAYFVKERDVQDTMNAMLHFWKNGKGDVLQLIQYAKKFNWSNTAENYLEMYKEALTKL